MTQLSQSVGSLIDGADRFDRLVKGVKDRQLSEALNAPAPKTVGAAFAVSPEEAWSRKFMTAGIGPQTVSASQMPAIGLAAPLGGEGFRPAMMGAPAAPHDIRPMPIGQTLAKPARERRRSWVGRFFFGD